MRKIFAAFFAALLVSMFSFAYAAEDNAYTVNGISFTGINGAEMENPSHSCMINAKVTKNKTTDDSDSLVIATYATDGTMIGWSTMTMNFDSGKTANFGTLVSIPADKTIGTVRAFVWDSIERMEPFSTVYEKIVNEMEEDAVIPDPSEDKYIPDTITVKAMLTASPKSDTNLKHNEYKATINLGLAVDSTWTETQYSYALKRWTRISSYYFGIASDGTPVNAIGQKFVSELDLCGKLHQWAYVTLTINEDGEREIINFEPNGDTDTMTFSADKYVKNADIGVNSFSNINKLCVDGKYYTMNTNSGGVDIYVNDTAYMTGITKNTANIDTTLDRLLGNAQGDITLLKDDGANGYSKIFLNYYEVAEVADIVEKTTGTTLFITINNGLTETRTNKIIIGKNSIASDYLSVKSADGTEMKLSDIKADDIIAVKTDLTNFADRTLIDPVFIEIIVSRNSAEGILNLINRDDETVTLGGKTYKAVDFNMLNGDSKFAVGDKYKITLDPFGRIYDYEAIESTKLYAVLERVNASDDTVTLVMGDGSSSVFELSGTGTATLTTASAVLNGSAYDTAYSTTIYNASVEKVAPQYRVVEYTVRATTGEITYLYVKQAVTGNTGNIEKFNARTNKLGSFALNNTTKILNAENCVKKAVSGDYRNSSIKDYKGMSVLELYDEEEYTAYAFNKVGNYYAFILITKAGMPVNSMSRFAVSRGYATKSAEEGSDTCYAMDALYNGQEETLKLADTVYVNGTAKVGTDINNVIDTGDAFFFEENSEGLIEYVYTIYDFAGKTVKDYDTVMAGFKGSTNLNNAIDYSKWSFGLQNVMNLKNQLAFGVITARNSNSVDLGVVVNNQINKNKADLQTGTAEGVYNFSFADDCVAYTYDLSDTTLKTKEALVAEASAAAIKASPFKLFENWYDSEIIDWTTTGSDNIEDYANYALVHLVDDEVVAIYEIVR